MIGEVVADRYELEELVGRGGMSSVFRAHDRLLERNVALKILHEQYLQDDDYVDRFRREARAAAQLSHPNIVTVIDRGEQNGRQFIVFEYVEGENLKQVIDRTGPLPVRDALVVALQMGRALAFAHEHGLVHRDVKPQNVLLNGDGRAKVTDFGIARSLDVEGVTQSGTVVGTSDYIAPEQAQGEHADAKSDVYSFGCVLYELLTGEVPFPGDNFVAVAMRHINDPPPNVLNRRHDVPARVAASVARAMAKEPEDRFASMDELVAELEACMREIVGEDRAETMVIGPRPPSPGRRRVVWPIAVVVAAVVVIGAAVAAALVLGGDEEAKSEAPAAPGTVRLTGVTAHDPEGDGREHDAEAPRATDRDPSTYWTTEFYRSFQKTGVGLVLRASRRVALRDLTLRTDTPGFKAEIRAGESDTGPFRTVSPARVIDRRELFRIDARPAGYYVIWILDPGPGGRARVNEVAARARAES
jgi:eukaryotic-like serine/threonine-protein kinase